MTLPAAYRFGRNANIVLWYTLTKGVVLAIYGLIFNLYLYSAGYDRQFIGLLNAVPAITSLLCSVPAGMLGDRLGYKPLLLLTGFASPIALLGFALSHAAPLLLVLSMCYGAITTFYWVCCVPLLADSVPEGRRVLVFSINSFLLYGAGSLGYLVGGQVVALAAALLHQSPHALQPLRWGMLSLVAFSALGAVPLLWLRDTRRARHEAAARPRYDLGLYARLLGPDMLLTCGGGAVFGFIGLYLTLRFGMKPDNLGLFLTASGVLGGVLILLAPRMARRLGTARTAIGLQAAGVPAVLLLALAPSQALAMAGEVLRNAFRSMGDPVYSAFVVSQVPAEQRATISGLYAATWSIGFSLGPAISGVVQQHAGFTPAFLLGGASMALGAGLLWGLFLQGPRRITPATECEARRRTA